MNNQREFVQIPEREIVDVTLKYPTGIQRDGQFGPYYLYTVLHDGKEKILKVTERLEKQFRKHDVKAGQVVSLLKDIVKPKNGEAFKKIDILDVKTPPKAEPPKEIKSPQTEEKPTGQTSNVNEVPKTPSITKPNPPEGFSGDALIMHQSLLDAIDITRTIEGVDWRNTDIEKIGVCLFLSRTGQLTPENVLSNGNGNGNGKRTRRPKKIESDKPTPTTTTTTPNPLTENEVPQKVEQAVTENSDFPF
jgi:hypothetical protein